MNGQPLLDVRNVGKRYSSRNGQPTAWVIRDLSFSVNEGEFLTIVGPSGAGKTTLLNILAQIDMATIGDIRFESKRIPVGQDVALNPGHSCRVGFVTQDDNLLPWRTTIDNVLLPLEVQGKLTSETRARAQTLVCTVGLAGFEHYYPHQLSGGMRKRAALIRTLVYDPPVILMDEPFSAVDAETRTVLQEDLLALWELGRKTIVFVTHDIAEAIALGDRTLVLTNAPARVRSEHQIEISRPRNIRDLAMDPAFRDLYRSIRAEVQATCATEGRIRWSAIA
jgi:NitT/TauT family transport system ATP-binding protein